MCPIYDFECKKCNKLIEVYESVTKSEEVHKCDCGGIMIKVMPTKMTFELLYDPKKDLVSWGNEGYARTQRYREYDKQAKKNIFPVSGGKK
ncbi:MAG TPA: hypothetical protein P5293_01355 [Bacteroidales bacterium]|nr:hypothetical protein [Bacteroidales bacterium]